MIWNQMIQKYGSPSLIESEFDYKTNFNLEKSRYS